MGIAIFLLRAVLCIRGNRGEEGVVSLSLFLSFSLSLSFSSLFVPPSFHRANIFLVGQLYITGHAR